MTRPQIKAAIQANEKALSLSEKLLSENKFPDKNEKDLILISVVLIGTRVAELQAMYEVTKQDYL